MKQSRYRILQNNYLRLVWKSPLLNFKEFYFTYQYDFVSTTFGTFW